jgi:hypothetical protein
VLTLDIERLPGQATVPFWGLGDYKHRRIHADHVTAWPRTVCVAWNWYGERRIHFASEWDDGPEQMHHRVWEAYDRADILYGHNVAGFDTKHLNSGWRDLGLPRPSSYQTVDTLKVARREFGDESKTLDALCRRLGITSKTDKYDVRVAQAAVDGNRRAQARIRAYNCGDVIASRALVDSFRGWITNHPHSLLGQILDETLTCNECGGHDLAPLHKDRLASVLTYPLYRCGGCGAPIQTTRHARRAANTRGAR